MQLDNIGVINLMADAFGVVILIFFSALGWFAIRLIKQVDAAPNKLFEKIALLEDKLISRMDSIVQTVQAIERDLRDDLVTLDRRVTRLEAGVAAHLKGGTE